MIPLRYYMESLKSDPVYIGFERVLVVHRTRRTVQIVRRKYLARKRRTR